MPLAKPLLVLLALAAVWWTFHAPSADVAKLDPRFVSRLRWIV